MTLVYQKVFVSVFPFFTKYFKDFSATFSNVFFLAMHNLQYWIKEASRIVCIVLVESWTFSIYHLLAALQTNLKRGQNTPKEANGVEPSAVPEFQKFKLKKISMDKERGKHDEQKEDSELMKKLGKQKRVAEAAGWSCIIFQVYILFGI